MELLEIINIFFVILIILFSGIVGWKRLKQGNASCILYGCYFIIFGLVQIFAIIFNAELPFSVEVRLKSNILNIIVLFFIFLGENLILRKKKTIKTINMEEKIKAMEERNSFCLSTLMWTALILSILGFILFILSKGVPIRSFLTSDIRTVYRLSGDYGSNVIGSWLFSLILVSNYISLIKRKWAIFTIGVLFTCVAVFLTGIRAYLIFSVGPFLYYYITSSRRKIKLKHVIFIILFFLSFFVINETTRLWRWQEVRTPQSFLEPLLNKETYTFILEDPGSLINYRIYNFQAVKLFPQEYEWLYGNTYKTILLFWLPSGLSKGLKILTMHKFADAVYGTSSAYEERKSVHPTLTGDFYINFGYLFWPPALIWGMGLAFIYIKAKKSIFWNLIAGSSLVYFLIFSFRGDAYLPFFHVMINTIFLISLIFILKTPIKRRESKTY